jgi:hypothetical protein
MLEDIVAQLGVTMKELAEAHKETERTMAKSCEEMERSMAKSRERHEEMERSMAKSHEETERSIAKSREETERSMAKSREKHEEMERSMAKSREEMERILAAKINGLAETVDKWIGYTGHSIGHIVELVLIPGIKKKMNECGHDFDTLAPRKLYYRKDGKIFTEIDLFLENGEEVMAVEVKTQLSVSAVEHHLRRLQLLRKHESEKLNDKTILAAVAGLGIDEDAREMALRLGMYVIEMVEDTKNITVIRPAGGLGKW